MSAFETLYDAHLIIGGHDIFWREIIGNAFGFASAVGGLRRRVWAWPVGIVGNLLLFTVFIGTAFQGQTVPLLGQAGRQVFFIVVSVYGWHRWRQRKRRNASDDAPAVDPRWATTGERAGYLAAAGAGVLALSFAFRWIGAGWPAPGWYYLADAWIFAGSMLATYAMARGWVDFWLCWIAVDLVGVPELIYFKLYPSATLYAVYAALVIYGFLAWRRIARETAPAGSAPELAGTP
jgi:nicotinamide mononucleotide transporter